MLPNELILTISAGNWGLDYVQNPAVFASAVDSNGNLILDGRMLVVGNWNTGEAMIEGNKAGHVCKDYSNDTCNDPYKTSDFYILAPGTGVYSTYNDGSYKTMSNIYGIACCCWCSKHCSSIMALYARQEHCTSVITNC